MGYPDRSPSLLLLQGAPADDRDERDVFELNGLLEQPVEEQAAVVGAAAVEAARRRGGRAASPRERGRRLSRRSSARAGSRRATPSRSFPARARVGDPGLERQPGRGEDRPRRDRRLPAAGGAAPEAARELPRLRRPAARADEAIRPAKASKVGETGQLIREPGLELAEGARVIDTADRTPGSESHPANVGARPDGIAPLLTKVRHPDSPLSL